MKCKRMDCLYNRNEVCGNVDFVTGVDENLLVYCSSYVFCEEIGD